VLTSDRPYKDAWSVDDDLLVAAAGEDFDPQLAPLFVKSLPEIKEIKEKYADKA